MRNLRTLFLLTLSCLTLATAHAQVGKCKGKYFGNITAGTVQSNYTANWNQMTMENESKWQSTEGSKGNFNFSNSDRGFNWAKNNNGLFKYHTLMWGAQTPGWVSSASSATLQASIPVYFKAVADHYTPMGGLKMIDVLNEPINTKVADNLKNALTAGYQAEPANANDKNNQYGWAIWCFQLARKNFPDAVLLINEYNVEMNWNNCRAGYIAMSSAIKNAPNLTDGKKNLIDGVDLQAHGINNLTAANFKACIDEIWTKTGLPVHITEFDATADPNETKQKDDYARLIPVAWEHPHVAGITLWGFIQGQTWIGGNKQTGSGGTDSGIIYANGQDRPAMTWLRSYLASQTSLACCPAPAPFGNCTNATNPIVSITSPTTNSNFTIGSGITITASASDPNGSITKVEFYEGTNLIGTKTASAYSIVWTPTTKGNYSITAKATDNSGNTTVSTAVILNVNVPQGPYNGTWSLIPGTIQFENFDVGGNGSAYSDASAGNTGGATLRMDEDVDIENCTDAGTGYNIGYATAGEWLEYSVDVQKPGTYDIDFRIACNADSRTLSLSLDGVSLTKDLAIPNTAGWQTWKTVSVKNVSLKAGKQILRLTIGASDYINLNYVTFTLVKELKQEPFNNTVHVIPGKIEAEEYDLGGEGLAYHEGDTLGNQGGATFRTDGVDIENCTDAGLGYNIGYGLKDEWLEYSVNVTNSGNYDVSLRVAKDGTGGLMHIEFDGVNVTGAITIPNTTGWQVWQTVTLPNIKLTAGAHIMKIVFDANYTNLNYVEFKDVVTGENIAFENEFSVYPNPFTNNVHINQSGAFNYKVTTLSGNELMKGTANDKLELGADLNGGVYILSIENATGIYNYKIVKQ